MKRIILNKKVLLIVGFIVASLIIIVLAVLDALSPSVQKRVAPLTPTPTKTRSSVAKPIPYVPTGAAIYYYNQKKDYVIYDPKYATLDEVKEMIKHPDD